MKKVNFKLYFRFSIIHWCTEGKNPFMVHAKQKQNEKKLSKTQNRQTLCMPKEFLNLAGETLFILVDK